VKVLQINSVANYGSTGRIAEQIGDILISNSHESYIAYGRRKANSSSKIYKITNNFGVYTHYFFSYLSGKHGFSSTFHTKKLLSFIDKINPDVICLHNIHGYYINIELLFEYLVRREVPVVWTFHDCWPFTGHCSHFENVSCFKWQSNCFDCPKISYYPKSLIDNSSWNFQQKKKIFTALSNLTIITPSKWLKNHVENSFFKSTRVNVIYNGVDTEIFKPVLESKTIKTPNRYLLFVSNIWNETKGFNDIFKLAASPVLVIVFAPG
jgi:glycosyltransferase involved in cell wall biosynthesis